MAVRAPAPARPRARWAEQCALHGALCFPLTAGGRVLGVLEFFAAERRRPQEELLQAVVALGSQLGEYIVRNRANAALNPLSPFRDQPLTIDEYLAALEGLVRPFREQAYLTWERAAASKSASRFVTERARERFAGITIPDC